MKDNFTASLEFVLRWECEFAPGHDNDLNYVVTENVEGDAGGLTKFGIDASDHPGVDIAGLTLADAESIYHNEEWSDCNCDGLPEGVDTAVFDAAVNMGVARSGNMLQASINSLGGYALAVDGVIGPKTSATAMAICAMADKRGLLFAALLNRRRALYQAIARANANDAQFLEGWLNRVDNLEKFISQGEAA